MGVILFCEYSITEEHRASFLAWVRRDPARWADVEFAENREQPGVFVELRRAASVQEAAAMKKERLEGRSWAEMEAWVKKGRDGIRVWSFAPVCLEPGCD